MEDSDEGRINYSANLMAWHEDTIEAAQKSDCFNELYLHSPEFIDTVERAIVVAKKSFPAKLRQYQHLLTKIKS